MSGGLNYAFREGNRSELLADYLLSSIAHTTPVRRQDDHGFDFYCQLSNNNDGYLTFGSPFMIQIKSKEKDNIIEYGQLLYWKPENLTWLFKNEIPFLIGVVDKKHSSLEIYDTTGLWQVYNINHHNPSKIQLQPISHPMGEMRRNCEQTLINDWEEGKGDGFNYKIDLGNPLISLTNEDLISDVSLTDRKNLLGRVVDIEQQNILYRKQHVRAFVEIKSNVVNSSDFLTGTRFEGRASDDVNSIFIAIRDALIVQLLILNAHGRIEERNILKCLLKKMPYAWYYDQLYQQNIANDIFDWIDPEKFLI